MHSSGQKQEEKACLCQKEGVSIGIICQSLLRQSPAEDAQKQGAEKDGVSHNVHSREELKPTLSKCASKKLK